MNDKAFHHRKNPNGFTKDHVVPRSMRGAKGSCNYILAHQKCNNLRRTRPFTVEEMERVGEIKNKVAKMINERRALTGQYQQWRAAPFWANSYQ